MLDTCSADDTGRFKEILRGARAGVGYVEAYSNGNVEQGTGFLHHSRTTLITNFHIIKNAQDVVVHLPGDEHPISCKLIDGRPDLDLAALRLDREPPDAAAVLALPDRVDIDPEYLDRILVVGNPRGLSLTPLLGHFSARREPPELARKKFGVQIPLYQLQIPGAGGQSGSPVFDKDGQAIGVFFAGEGEGEFDLNYAIPHRNVRQLSLDRRPRRFSNLPNIPHISTNFAGTGVSNLSNSTSLRVGDRGQEVSLESRHWGFAPRDPDLVFRNYVDDLARFSAVVPRRILDQVVRRKNLLVVTNAAFGYRVLVPQGYSITERRVPGRFFESRITFPKDNGGVRILATNIKPPRTASELALAFDINVRSHANNVLRKVIVPAGTPVLGPSDVVIDPNPLLSDAAPRRNNRTGDLRLWRHYMTAKEIGWSHLVMYRLRDDLFLSVDITFPTGILGRLPDPTFVIPERFVEDMVVANSFVDMF